MTSCQFGSWKRVFTATENCKFSWHEKPRQKKATFMKSSAIIIKQRTLYKV